jgi:hypothetical protein
MSINRTPLKISRKSSTEEIIVSEHLADLRNRVRLLTWVSGLCWTALALFGGLLITGTLDWLLHFDESGTRLVLGLSLLGLAGWMFWRQLIAPLLSPLSATFLANRVEKRFPGLNNRLLSAVEFLEHRLDSKLGSTELQKAVVGQALNELEKIETSDVIETKAVRNVTIAGAIVTFLTALVFMLYPSEAATSVKRLVFPFSHVPWPRNVELKLVRPDLSPVVQAPDQPLVIARGDTLELYVENRRGRLPERVWFEYRTGDDGPIAREGLRQTTLRDEKGRSREAAVISWVATRGTMQFRASGGDDNVMPFYQVNVVPPPNIDSLQVTLTPPAYSRQPVQVLPPGVGHVQGLVGSKIDVVAMADKSLQSARLRVGEQPAVPMSLHDEARRFSSIFEIKEAVNGSYWFELTDTQGFTDRDSVRYELRGIADGIPDVTIETPSSDVLLTADSELAVAVLAKDDLRLRQIRIAYQVGDDEKPKTIPLFDREQETSHLPGSQDDSNQTGPQRHEASFVWKMSELNPQPGMRIVFRAEATDDYDLGQPHVGKSIPRTITIVSRDEKQRELAMRVGDLLEDLQKATQMQKRARQQTQDLQTQLEKVGELRSQDLDQLQRAELDQRQTTSRLTNPAESVETQARQLLDEFRANRLGDEPTEQRLEHLSNELNRLERDELSDAERALTQAQKFAEKATTQDTEPLVEKSNSKTSDSSSRSNATKNNESSSSSKQPKSRDKSGDLTAEQVAKEVKPGEEQNSDNTQGRTDSNDGPSPDQSKTGAEEKSSEQSAEKSKEVSQPDSSSPSKKGLRSALAEAQAQQARSLESLTELQDLLSEWRDQRDVSKDLSSVISEQEKLQQDADNMAQQTMSKSSAELSRQEKAELDKLAVRQRRVAEQLDQLRKQLDKAADNLKENDPDSAEKLSEVGQELNQRETTSKLQDAADKINENRMGAAAESQKQALDELHEIERMMKRQPNEDTEQFLKQTQEALQEFQQLREEQQSLADRAAELNQQEDSLEKKQKQEELMQEQEDLTERMAKAERKLERLRLRGAAEAAHRARKRITEMMKHIQEADDGEEVHQAMEEALDDLEQVERELVLEKRIAQDRLAFEQLEKIEDQLKSLRARQEPLIAETIRLEEAKKDEGRITRGQIKTLLELAETERSLQHTAEQMGQQMASAEVFSLVLKRLARSMKFAADALGERETSEKTQAFERDALRKIDNLLAVLKQEQKKQQPAQKPEEKPEELSQEPQEREEKPEEAQPPGDMLPQLAQLKLLKSLQEEYLERTEMLDKFRDKDGKLPDSMREEKDELAREQAELADFARNLITKFLQQQADRKDDKAAEDKAKEREQERDATKIEP